MDPPLPDSLMTLNPQTLAALREVVRAERIHPEPGRHEVDVVIRIRATVIVGADHLTGGTLRQGSVRVLNPTLTLVESPLP